MHSRVVTSVMGALQELRPQAVPNIKSINSVKGCATQGALMRWSNWKRVTKLIFGKKKKILSLVLAYPLLPPPPMFMNGWCWATLHIIRTSSSFRWARSSAKEYIHQMGQLSPRNGWVFQNSFCKKWFLSAVIFVLIFSLFCFIFMRRQKKDKNSNILRSLKKEIYINFFVFLIQNFCENLF